MNSELYGKAYGEVQSRDLASEYVRLLDRKLGDVSGMKVMELGVGSGSLSPYLKGKVKEGSVFGVDINGWLLRDSEKIRQLDGAIEGNIERLPVKSGSIDRVVSLHTFEHVRDLRMAMSELERILAPNGEALLIVPKPQLGIKELGALFDTLKMYPGFANLLKAWKMAGEYHVQNVTPQLVEDVSSGIEISSTETMFVPSELGSVWVMTIRKRGK